MDRHRTPMQLLWLSPLLWMAVSGVAWAESPQPERSKGLTVQDLARGVRSAAQNIEKEIPKVGAAIGKAVTSISANSLEQKPTQQRTAAKK
ncbi:MAG: hypothetical protein HP496_03230 [Nitrospira sp.]|nr:hypothetical protein [Nitrospira sp.]